MATAVKSIELTKKEAPETGDYDIIVVGGGTAGSVAAIAAARAGLKCLLIEQFNSLGGSQTMALVTPTMSACVEGRSCACSISKEIVQRLLACDGAAKENPDWFDPQAMKIVLEEILLESGADVLFDSSLADAAKEGSRLTHAIVLGRSGLSAYKAKTFIDCSGDATLALASGVEIESGGPDGFNQAISLRFELSGVDIASFSSFLKSVGFKSCCEYPLLHAAYRHGFSDAFDELVSKGKNDGLLTDMDLSHFQIFSIPGRPGSVSFNSPELGKSENAIDPAFTSERQREAKRSISRIANFMRRRMPGFDKSRIGEIAPLLGVRESRRIVAERQLTKEDIYSFRKFEDGIVASNYPLDIHGGNQFEKTATYAKVPKSEAYWEIPYRALVPKGADNLLVAGRCAGFDFFAQSAARVQHSCRAMGQAAGIAAAIAAKEAIPFREVDGKTVRKTMRSLGSDI